MGVVRSTMVGSALCASLLLSTARTGIGAPPPKMVLTFSGVRALEDDQSVPDEEKVKAWEAFIARTDLQLEYARKAARYWKEAKVLRLEATARALEDDQEYPFEQRVEQWKAVLAASSGERAARAQKRVAHWSAKELQRRIDAAEAVEKEGALKVARISAWRLVVQWSPKSTAGRAAAARIAALQAQLLREAEAAEQIERLDTASKIELWKDVLRGEPSDEQRRKAEQRIQALR